MYSQCVQQCVLCVYSRVTVEVLPTCYVPQLQPDHSVVVPLQNFQGKVHPYGGSVVLGEDLMDVPLDDGCFSDSQVPDDQDFEQKLLLHGCSSAGNSSEEL